MLHILNLYTDFYSYGGERAEFCIVIFFCFLLGTHSLALFVIVLKRSYYFNRIPIAYHRTSHFTGAT